MNTGAGEKDQDDIEVVMDMDARRLLWRNFLVSVQWSCVLLFLILAYPVMVVSMDIHWVGAVVVLAGLGFAAGAAMKMGQSLNIAVISLAGVAVLIEIVKAGFQALI